MRTRTPQVGDKINAATPPGRIVDETVKAVLETSKGRNYVVSFGQDQSAAIHERDVLREMSSGPLLRYTLRRGCSSDG